MTNLASERDVRAATDVFVSDLLEARHPSFHHELGNELARFGLALRQIPGTRDIWCRDYMPLPIGRRRFVQFGYAPDYLADAPWLITPAVVATSIAAGCRRSRLVVDGGNVVRRGHVAIVTMKVFAENSLLPRRDVERELRDSLEVDSVVVIPVDPGDVLGHADGVLHLVDEHTALVNDYAKVDRGYCEALRTALHAHRIEVVPIPYMPDMKSRRRIAPATGVYVNVLEKRETILVPTYGIGMDEPALEAIRRASGKEVAGIDCRAIAREGGALRCVTWCACA